MLKDRLAIPHAGHERKRTQYGYTAYWTLASKFDLMNRLGEYEDIGLTPEEIKARLAEPTKFQIKTTISNIDRPQGVDEEQLFAVLSNQYSALAKLYGDDVPTYHPSEDES